MMSIVASQQLVHIFTKIAQSSMWNSIESHPPHIPQKHFCMLHCSFEEGIGRILEGWFSLQFYNQALQHQPSKTVAY